MRDLFLENPIAIGLIGLAISSSAIFAWTQFPQPGKQRWSLYVAISVLAATVLLVILSLSIETDKEKIRETLDNIAAALEKNDLEKVFKYIHPNAQGGLQRAKAELPSITFLDARITRIKSIEISHKSTPPTAIAEFNAVVDVNVPLFKGRVARFVRAYFMQRDDQWLVRDYEHFDPTVGFRDNPLIVR